MGHQVAGDVGEAGVDVLPHVLELLVLVLRDLKRTKDTRVRHYLQLNVMSYVKKM